MNNSKKIRIVVSVFLIFGILAISAYMLKNKDSLFTSIAQIKYPDGCIEEYKGTKLITDECTRGREIYRKQKEGDINASKMPYNVIGGMENLTLWDNINLTI